MSGKGSQRGTATLGSHGICPPETSSVTVVLTVSATRVGSAALLPRCHTSARPTPERLPATARLTSRRKGMQTSWSWALASSPGEPLLLRGVHATPFRGLPSVGCVGPTSCHLEIR